MSISSKDQEIVRNILSKIKGIDQEIGEIFENYDLHALPFASDVRFVLGKAFLRRVPTPKLFVTLYDYYVLYFLQLGIVRSLRYMGQQELAPLDTLFKVKKMRLQRDEQSKLGEELFGCFISHGQIELESLTNYKLLLIKYLYGNLIKPLAIVRETFSSILPTPFSSISIITREGEKKLLVPCNLLLLIDYKKAKESSGYILGERLNFIDVEIYAFASIYDEKSMKKVKCKVIGPFRAIIPKIEQVDEKLYEEYFNRRDAVISNIAGIIVMSNNMLLKNSADETGYILAFYETPFDILSNAFVHIGEILNVTTDDHIFKNVKIKLNRELLNLFQNKISGTMNYAEKNYAAKKAEIMDSEVIKVMIDPRKEGWIEESDEHLYLYAPALIWFSTLSNIEFSEITSILNELLTEKTPRKLIFDKKGMIDRRKLELREKLLNLRRCVHMWNKVFTLQRSLAEIYRLYVLV